MDYVLLLRSEARVDLLDAFHWYQNQQEGLGHDFKSCVNDAFLQLEKHPKFYKKVHADIRRVIIKKFPFGIFYVVKDNEVTILAVLHARRNPIKWKSRGR